MDEYDISHLDAAWALDSGVERVREFHEAFDIVCENSPWLPELTQGDRRLLHGYARQLGRIAAELKAQAAEANGLGRHALGRLLVRLQLHVEETGELADAYVAQDMVAVFDALTDISYVSDGTYLTHGLGALKVAGDEEVHASNMSKLDANGRPIIHLSGRVVKSDQYRPPNLAGVLEKYRDRMAGGG